MHDELLETKIGSNFSVLKFQTDRLTSYPEIGNANFKGSLWTFKQQLTLKCESIVKFLLLSYKRLCSVHFGIRREHEESWK